MDHRRMPGWNEERAGRDAERVLRHLRGRCDAAVLAELAGVSEREAARALARSEEGRPEADGEPRREHAGDAGAGGSSFADALRLLEDGEAAAFCERTVCLIGELLEDKRFAAARAAHDVMTRVALKLKLSVGDANACRAFIRFCLEGLARLSYLPWEADGAFVLLHKVRGAAFALGDRRSQAKVDLMLGCLDINMAPGVRSTRCRALMRRGVTTLYELGDADLFNQTALYLCVYYFFKGDFLKAIGCSVSYIPDSRMAEDRHTYRMLLSYAALSALYLGEFKVAEDIIRLGLNSSLKESDRKSLMASLGYIYLMQKREDEAFAVIDEVLDLAGQRVQTYADLWAARALAYYHYSRGKVRASWSCLRNWQERTQAKGLVHANYPAAPFVLEMLYAYERERLPLPRGHSFADELSTALNGPSPLLRGMALRMQGELVLNGGGEGREEAGLRLLEESRALFATLTAPVEAAKTTLALALFHLGRGDVPRALPLAAEAWEVCRRYGHPAWPAALDSLRRRAQLGEKPCGAAGLTAFLTRLFQGVRQYALGSATENGLRAVLYAMLNACGATGGGVFRLRDGKIQLLAGANLPEGAWRDAGSPLAALLRQADAGRVPLRQDREEHPLCVLCLPGEADEDGRCLLYVEGSLIRDIRELLNDEVQRLLAAYFATESALALRRLREKGPVVTGAAAPDGGRADGVFLVRSPAMAAVVEQADKVAVTDTSVLILGESGVGKELVARRLHERSGRSGPFVAVNLSSTPEELFESELFGHEKGSFTGAASRKIGLLELADKGTLFIDEAGDIPLRLQVKLLRVLQEKLFLRVGGTQAIRSDFRLVAATNRDLSREVREGRFREDLFYRLSVIPLRVPPLRERPEDLLPLAEYFIRHFAARHHYPAKPLTPEEREFVLCYAWPGNVRELKNAMERHVILRHAALSMEASPSPPVWEAPAAQPGGASAPDALFAGLAGQPVLPTLDEMQSRYVEYVYVAKKGVLGGKNGVAAALGVSRSTAYAWMQKLGLRERFAKTVIPVAGGRAARRKENFPPGAGGEV